jgi:hypothetical protein
VKCNPKRTLNIKYEREREEKERQEQEYLASLSDEEREQYLEAKRKRQEEAWGMFESLVKLADKMGIRKYY